MSGLMVLVGTQGLGSGLRALGWGLRSLAQSSSKQVTSSKASEFLPSSLSWQSEAAVAPYTQLLGFKSSKIPISEPRLPSRLFFTHPALMAQ